MQQLKFVFLLVVLFCSGHSIAQVDEAKVTNAIVAGNEKAKEAANTAAEVDYRKALALDPKRTEAQFNLANNHYAGAHYDEAEQRYFLTQKNATNRSDKHSAFHNLGNVHMQNKDYAKAVESYKNALRNNPMDDETRYNYALAKSLLEDEQQQNQQQDQNDDQNQNQDQNQEQNQDQDKNQDKNQDQDQNSDQEQEGDDGEDKEDENDGEEKDPKDDKKDQEKDQKDADKNDKPQQPKQQPKEGQLSPEQIKSLLEAMNNQEKKVQDKVNAKKAKGVPVKGKKDW